MAPKVKTNKRPANESVARLKKAAKLDKPVEEGEKRERREKPAHSNEKPKIDVGQVVYKIKLVPTKAEDRPEDGGMIVSYSTVNKTGTKFRSEGVVFPGHFSDDLEQSNALVKLDVFVHEKAVCLGYIRGKPILSCKRSLVEFSHKWPKTFEDIVEGSFHVGYVTHVGNKGGLVCLGPREIALGVKKADISDSFVSDPTDVLKLGQTLVVQVLSVDPEANRGHVSSKFSVVKKWDHHQSFLTNRVKWIMELEAARVNVAGMRDPDRLHLVQSITPGMVLKDIIVEEGGMRIDGFSKTRVVDIYSGKKEEVDSEAKGKVQAYVMDVNFFKKLVLVVSDPSIVSAATQKRGKIDGKPMKGKVLAYRGNYMIVFSPVLDKPIAVPLPFDSRKCEAGEEVSFKVPHGAPIGGGKFYLGEMEQINSLGPRAQRLALSAEKEYVVGQEVEGEIKKVCSSWVDVALPGNSYGRLDVMDTLPSSDPSTWVELPLAEFKRGDKIHARVREIQQQDTRRIMRLTLNREEQDLKPRVVAKTGEKLSGYILNSGKGGIIVGLGPTLQGWCSLRNASRLFIEPEEATKKFPAGSLLKDLTVLQGSQESSSGRAVLSIMASAALSISSIKEGEIYDAVVKKYSNFGVFVGFPGSTLQALVHSSNMDKSLSRVLKPGDACKVKILEVDEEKERVAAELRKDLLKKKAEAEDEEEEEEEEEAEEVNDEEEEESEDDEEEEEEDLEEEDDVEDDTEEDVGFGFETEAKPKEDAMDDGEGDGEEDSEGETEKKKRTKKERLADKRAKEERIQEIENRNMGEDWKVNPKSTDDFERLLVSEGSSSATWVKYMAYWLKMGDIDKAREIGERAVKSPQVTADQEKFNIWVAFMNLEASFGTLQTLESVFRKACMYNEPKKIYIQLTHIREKQAERAWSVDPSGGFAELQRCVDAHESTCSKFGSSKKVWLAYITFLYLKAKDAEEGRKILARCLKKLDKRKHLMVCSKIAQLEFRSGNSERGRTLFETILKNNQKRLDIWSIYCDEMIKAFAEAEAEAGQTTIRAFFQRTLTLSLKPQKMKFFFKRWLDFEKKFGSEDDQQKVKEKAQAFVDGISEKKEE